MHRPRNSYRCWQFVSRVGEAGDQPSPDHGKPSAFRRCLLAPYVPLRVFPWARARPAMAGRLLPRTFATTSYLHIVLIVQINQKNYKKVLAKMRTLCYTIFRQRECWNWQTGKTKDLVGVCSCGFKSHLPHIGKWQKALILFRFSAFFIFWMIRFLSHVVSRFWVVGLLYLVVAVGRITPVGLFVRCWFGWKCNVLIFILFIRNTFHLNICLQCDILHLYNRIESRMWFLIIWCPLILWKEGDALWTQWKFLLYC